MTVDKKNTNTAKRNNSRKTVNSKTQKAVKNNTNRKKTNSKSNNTLQNKNNTKKINKNVIKSQTNKKSNNNIKTKRVVKTQKKATGVRNTKKSIKKKPSVKIIFLGGLNEIGKNITLFEYENDIIILDCGMAFPDGDMLGIDLVIPDFSYIEENKKKIKGIIITHGHEDHIGALPYLLKKLDVPVYGTALTIGLIENKLKEHSIGHDFNSKVKKPGEHIKLGHFDVELIHVNHSIPDAVGVAIKTKAGTIVHTGDFKIDFTPMSGEMTDLARFSQLGTEGVLALMADSTNADTDGYTPTEQKVLDSLDNLFRKARKKRIIVATFASNISRVQQIINCADKFTRKVAFSGRSMENIMNTAKELGYLKVPENILISLNEIDNYPGDKVVVITTGSQGEPMSALTRMANSDHKKIEVGAGDFIIISANPIPGNEANVGYVVDELLKKGCEVVYESMYDVHVSGHACQQELKMIQSLVKPKYFIPVHGEQKHLMKHRELALSLGMPQKNVYIGDNGKVVELSDDYIKEVDTVTAGRTFVDGLGVGDVGSVVLRDRKTLSEDGIIIITAAVDSYTGTTISGPSIISRGFVYIKENEDLMEEIKDKAIEIFDYCERKRITDWNSKKTKVKDEISRFVYSKTKRRPVILVILQPV